MNQSRMTLCALALGNLLVSLCGGLVLGRGLSLSETFKSFPFDSVLAYLAGSFLAFLAIVFSRRLPQLPLAKFSFALAVPTALLVLLSIFGNPDETSWEVLFAAALCVYFAVAATLRAFRSDISAILNTNGLMVSELSYSSGYLLGLLLPVQHLPLSSLFIGQLAVLPLVWALDIYVARKIRVNNPESLEKAQLDSGGVTSLILSFLVFFGMTGCVQICIHRLASHFQTSLPIVAFEAGVTMAPIVAMAIGLTLVFRNGGLVLGYKAGHASFLGAMAITLLFALLGLHGFQPLTPSAPIWVGALFIGSFGYEFLSLALLSYLGQKPRQVMVILGANGFTCSMVYWGLLRLGDSGLSAVVGFGVACTIVSLVSLLALNAGLKNRR